MAKPRGGPRSARTGLCLALLACACGVDPSRTPLGGNYDAPPLGDTTSSDRRAARSTPPAPTPATNAAVVETALEAPPAPPASTAVAVVAPSEPSNTLVYRPLKAGDRIEAEVDFGFDAELRGGPPGLLANGKMHMDSKQRVELKIGKASAQSLDELELTVTTLFMHTEFAGHGSDAKPAAPEVYDVALGQSPSIHARSGSKLTAADRAALLILVAPLADFHAHWGRSPTLDLQPGWSSKVTVTLPTFPDSHGEAVKAGPLGVAYAGRDRDHVRFDVTLPIEYGADMGTLDFDLKGKATLSADSARPTAFDLSGPFTAQGRGASRSQLSFSGNTKFSATLSYR